MRSTFAGFTTARLALRASQKALDVTGQNIANINTDGYTRQRLDLISLTVGSGPDRYKSENNVYIGAGVLTAGISQIRDPFLDIRFRNEIGHVGATEQRKEMLKDLESIFDEVSKTGIQNQLSDMSTMLQKLSLEVGNNEFDHMVRASADVLTKMLNQYAHQLNVVKSDHEYNLDKVELPKVNDILNNIKKLNETIKANHVHGNPALELMDQRNLLIDELASYVNIKVETGKEDIGTGRFIETLKIKIEDQKNNRSFYLIDDNKKAEFKKMPENGANYGEYKVQLTDTEGTLHDDVYGNLTTGIIKASFDMLNKSGEFGGNNNETRGLGYYEKSLDLLASKIASTFNKLNVVDPAHTTVKTALFATNDGSTNFTASNIKISDEWQSGSIKINASKSSKLVNGKYVDSGSNENILKMISSISEKMDYKINEGAPDEKTIFKGSFQEYFTNIGSVLGLDINSTDSMMKNHKTVAKEIANMRDSISQVSLDEEGMSLLHYQKSYNAAARLMTTLDEAVATIINNMGIVGR